MIMKLKKNITLRTLNGTLKMISKSKMTTLKDILTDFGMEVKQKELQVNDLADKLEKFVKSTEMRKILIDYVDEVRDCNDFDEVEDTAIMYCEYISKRFILGE